MHQNLARSLNILILSICILLLSISAHGQSAISPSSYAFLTGIMEEGNIDIYNIDYAGTITYRSRTDLWALTPKSNNAWEQMMDPMDAIMSPKGEYVFFYDFSGRVGAIFSIDNQLSFHLIKMQNYGCGGAGFTQDGKYCFSSNSFSYTDQTPIMNIYQVNGGRFDLVTTQSVPTTGTMGSVYISNSKDEIIGTAVNGYLSSYRALNVYQFDRVKEELVLKDRMNTTPDNLWYFSAADEGNVLVHSHSHSVSSIARQTDGTFKSISSFWRLPEWQYTDGASAPRLTKDAKYAVVCVANIYESEISKGGGGVALFAIKPTGELEYLSMYPLLNATSLDITPDNRFVVVGYEGGLKLAVFKINRQQGILEKVSEIAHPGSYVFFIRFFPQCYPKTPVEEKNWQLYSTAENESPQRH